MRIVRPVNTTFSLGDLFWLSDEPDRLDGDRPACSAARLPFMLTARLGEKGTVQILIGEQGGVSDVVSGTKRIGCLTGRGRALVIVTKLESEIFLRLIP